MAALLGLAVAGCDASFFSRSKSDKAGGTDLRSVSPADLNAMIGSQRGHVVLVDFWATWCPPCRELFPHNVALARQYGAKGLHVLTVSLDGAARAANVKSFLQEQRAETMNFLADDSALAGGDPFDIGTGIPLVKIYDRRGVLQKAICGGGSENEALIDETVRALLAAK